LPGATFLFPPTRDNYPGWVFLDVFMRGFQALPQAVKDRHAPFHVRIERPDAS
jgi:hypothetical protein